MRSEERLKKMALDWLNLKIQLDIEESFMEGEIARLKARFEGDNSELIYAVNNKTRMLRSYMKSKSVESVTLPTHIVYIQSVKGRPSYAQLFKDLLGYVDRNTRQRFTTMLTKSIELKTKQTLTYKRLNM